MVVNIGNVGNIVIYVVNVFLYGCCSVIVGRYQKSIIKVPQKCMKSIATNRATPSSFLIYHRISNKCNTKKSKIIFMRL